MNLSDSIKLRVYTSLTGNYRIRIRLGGSLGGKYRSHPMGGTQESYRRRKSQAAGEKIESGE